MDGAASRCRDSPSLSAVCALPHDPPHCPQLLTALLPAQTDAANCTPISAPQVCQLLARHTHAARLPHRTHSLSSHYATPRTPYLISRRTQTKKEETCGGASRARDPNSVARVHRGHDAHALSQWAPSPLLID